MNNKRYSESLENYLETICLFGGENVKSVDIARHLKVSRASVNKAINTLIDEGLVNKELYGDVSLTEEGKRISTNVLWKHNMLREFLIDVLKVDPTIATKEACGIEHMISTETAKKLEDLMKKIKAEN
ncbi:metal-dependent transcriptional regulator [Candidatus Izemoplasma sp. B36]|uniref:metal-dependent transcriptional regulator n=1 Tax=Candidatus Izemoplasma sp. B36 TaxID=3242468 RepID=UPI0035581738